MAKRIKKPHPPALRKAENQTRDHAVVDSTLRQGAEKGKIGGHTCEAISFCTSRGFVPLGKIAR